MENNIQTEVSTSSPAAATPPPAAAPPPAVEAAAPAAPQSKFEGGGEMMGNKKIQWLAIGIISLSIISLAMKSLYYNKASKQLDKDKVSTGKKLKELEKNIRALRKDKYESIA